MLDTAYVMFKRVKSVKLLNRHYRSQFKNPKTRVNVERTEKIKRKKGKGLGISHALSMIYTKIDSTSRGGYLKLEGRTRHFKTNICEVEKDLSFVSC